MAYRKSGRNQQFTVVYQEVAQHKTMSMEARGLLLFMLSLPDDWEYHKSWIKDQCPNWGREKLSKILKELEQKGYLIRTSRQDQKTGKMLGWDWEVLAESALNTDLRQTRHSVEPVRQNSTDTDLRVCRQTGLPSDCKPVRQTNKKEETKETSKSVNNAREENFSLDEVMTGLQALGLPENETWYAQMKVREYITRYPESQSMADACRYVSNAISHAWSLEGKTQ